MTNIEHFFSFPTGSKDNGPIDQVSIAGRILNGQLKPALYRVLLLKDSTTPTPFIVSVLEHALMKQSSEVESILNALHTEGTAHCGTFPHDVAETKANQILEMAHRHGHTLRCIVTRD